MNGKNIGAVFKNLYIEKDIDQNESSVGNERKTPLNLLWKYLCGNDKPLI